MKILIVLTYYRPHWTGLTKNAARLAEALAHKGHKVAVLCVQHQKKLKKNETINKVTVTRVPFLFKFIRTVVAPAFLFELLVLALKSEVIVIYLPLLEILPATIIAKLARKKVFLIHNGDLILPEKEGLVGQLSELVYYTTTHASIRLSDETFVHTKDYSKQSQLLSKSPDKWREILPLYTPVESSKSTNARKKYFKKSLRLTQKKLIGFSGRFVEEKGIDFLLKAIPMVLEKEPSSHFIFAGEYKIKYENFLEKIKPEINKQKKHITLLGLIRDKKKLDDFYYSLELLVIPSRTDCFPTAQVEALLKGIPVVCTDIPGARWVVRTTGMGVLVKPQSPSSLAKGILKVMKDRNKFVVDKEHIKKVFNYEKTIEEYEKIFTN